MEPTEQKPRRIGSILMIIIGLVLFAGVLVVYVRRVHKKLPMIQNSQYVDDCRQRLSYAFSMEKQHFAEKDAYSDKVYETMASVLPTHYAFVMADGGVLAKYSETLTEDAVGWLPSDNSLTEDETWRGVKAAAAQGVVPGVEGVCPKCEVTVLCVGQMDDDATLDVWSVSTKARKLQGETVEAGMASHDVNDFEE
ncbi:MAG: hypothetical protein ACJ790_06420 [Myxococcaceae bacterium]